MLEVFLVSSLSPSQLWTLKTTAALERCQWTGTTIIYQTRVSAYHPMNLFRMKIAAMGKVDDRVDDSSGLSLLATGSW